jgi:hypothetical protein
MFLHAFLSMFVSSLREFPENCVLICLSYTSTEEITDLYQNVSHFWLELNTYKNVVIEHKIYCFNMQNQ